MLIDSLDIQIKTIHENVYQYVLMRKFKTKQVINGQMTATDYSDQSNIDQTANLFLHLFQGKHLEY
jgi:hypothetical protein